MKTKTQLKTLLSIVGLCALAAATVHAQLGDAQSGTEIAVSPSSARPAQPGPAKTFTGKVSVKTLFDAKAPGRTSGAEVTFEPKARTFWHTHPLGQTLVVTKGTGWVGQWDGAVRVMKAGDVVQIPAGTKHWHGGTSETSVTHIAIQESGENGPVTWLEPVSEEQYAQGNHINKER